MVKKTVIILLLLAIVTTLARFTLPYAWYYSNYQYITTELCVNRGHPEIHCNGSCQLERMIQKQHNQPDQEPIPVEQEQRINVFLVEQLLLALIPDLYSNASLTKTIWPHSLWINEPTTPPPKVG